MASTKRLLNRRQYRIRKRTRPNTTSEQLKVRYESKHCASRLVVGLREAFELSSHPTTFVSLEAVANTEFFLKIQINLRMSIQWVFGCELIDRDRQISSAVGVHFGTVRS